MDVPYNKEITYIAKTHFRNEEKVFGIKKKDRRQHMYVLGKSGTGKSALLYNMIIQNIANGEGVCVVDPHGELVEDVLRAIPQERINDVVYFNPADTDYHIGFNVLELPDPQYKHLVASGLMSIFTKMWANTWSARMEYILNNAILALLDTPGTTLLGIPRILVDKDYRQQIVSNLKDPVVKTFWIHEYEAWQDKFRNEAIAPIQNKVGQFLSTSIIRNVVGQSKSTMDVFDIMNTGKIFLVNVSKGRIGEDNSALIGGMIITKIQLAAMERVRIPEPERLDFYLYVDEFQNFVTDSFASILSEARKYRLNLIIAHQYTAQLKTDSGDAVRDAVFGNVGTMIVFRVGADDADFLEKEFAPEFLPEDILAQPNYHIYLKLMVDGITSRPFSAFTLPPMKIQAADDSKEQVIENSRRVYAKRKEDIENEINSWSGLMGGAENNKPSEAKWKATCSTCGKEVAVPFEPQEGRPVYCKECMAKIKDGTLKPVKNFKVNPRKQLESNDALAALGIEFTPAGQTPLKINRADQKDIPKQQQQTRPQPQVDTNEKNARKPMPAFDGAGSRKPTDKKPGEKFVHPPRKGPDKEDLGKVLADALKDAGKLFPTKDAKPDTGVERTLATPVVPVVPPAVSLSALKSQSAPVTSTFSKKEQSEENKDELRKVLAGLMSKKDKSSEEHNHADAKIQEPTIARTIDAEDRVFREAEADTVEEVKDIIDKEQERQKKENELAVARKKEQEERENREREEREKRERDEAIAREQAQKEREEKERQQKLEQEIRERRERIERERKELEEKLAREKEERERQQAIARAEEEKKREIARQKEEAEAKRIREELQTATAQKEEAEAKMKEEERAQQEADKEAEAWLRNQKERRVYTDREGKVVPPVVADRQVDEDVNEDEPTEEQPPQQRVETPKPVSPTKKKKEVPEDLLRQILG